MNLNSTIQKVSAPRLLYDNIKSIQLDDNCVPLVIYGKKPMKYYIVFYNYMEDTDRTAYDVFVDSKTLGYNIEEQLERSKTRLSILSIAREIDNLKPIVKEFAEKFLKFKTQYKEFKVYSVFC